MPAAEDDVPKRAKRQPTGDYEVGYAWWDEIKSGKATFKEIVKREKLSRRFVAIHLDLAFLAPDLVTSILEGAQQAHLSAQVLRSTKIATEWRDQRSLLNFIAS